MHQGVPTPEDAVQGKGGTCWFISALSAVSRDPSLIQRLCVARDEPTGVYGFLLFTGRLNRLESSRKATNDDALENGWDHIIIDDYLYIETDVTRYSQPGCEGVYFAVSAHKSETYVSLMEKMYAKAHDGYQSTNGGNSAYGALIPLLVTSAYFKQTRI